ncbi:hypothetical protein F511_05405 [Dorcoceras hygrometricum]|uniref:UBN2 domain-containing protein n=1 Tax=Dorcoceras hygrometricum TaxID=472368 RepID=A0A2Z7BG07_9LAMI|nr:hypothetical protein F511_05405 [Dorcoceras hygrometricum]
MFSKIKTCATAKEIWEKLVQICEGNDETKENKLTVAQHKYESIKMKDGETMAEFDERFSDVIIELTSLGKEYSNRELALKVMRALPKEWDVKTMAMRESKDLNKLELHDLFANLKAYEFELETRSEAPSTSQPTKALEATTSVEQCSPSTGRTADQLSNDVMSLFVKKFGKYLRRSYNPSFQYNANKSESLLIKTALTVVDHVILLLIATGLGKRIDQGEMKGRRFETEEMRRLTTDPRRDPRTDDEDKG